MNLTGAFNAQETKTEFGEIIRGPTDEIRLVPDGDGPGIRLKGEFAEMPTLSQAKSPDPGDPGSRQRW